MTRRPLLAFRNLSFAFLLVSALPVERPGIQGQELTVEAVIASAELRPDGLPNLRWTPDGRRFTYLERSQDGATDLVSVNPATGGRELVVDGSRLVAPGEIDPLQIEGYQWSPDGSDLLVYTRSVRVWRANTKGVYFVLELASGTLRPLSTAFGYQQFAKFSPDGSSVGFVRDNDLFVVDLESMRERRLTSDGSDLIVNGTFDWVYEEELGLQDGWRWSPDGQRIAFWRLDQTPIKDFFMIDDLTLYSTPVPIPYPKAGEANSTVEVGVLDLASGGTTWMDLGDNPDTYIARMDWARSPSELLVQRLNRHQNRLDVMVADASTGTSRVLFTEESETWVDVDDDLTWVDDDRFLWTSDRDGFMHVYLYDRSGEVVNQVTSGAWDVTALNGVSADRAFVYVTAAKDGPLGRQLYRASVDGGQLDQITSGEGTHQSNMSPGGHFFIDAHSRFGVPPTYTLRDGEGGEVNALIDNAGLNARLAERRLGTTEFFTFTTSDGVDLNGWMIKPPDFDPSRRYPVLMYVYGGPGSQTAADSWGGTRYLWHQLVAQKGYVVASVDGRGTGARGRDFKKMTYLNLGRVETNDQVEAARHLGGLPFVDESRIAIWGWSYGGYMTLNALTRGEGIFAAGISVAPVTHWKFYDTIYTERFMRTPRENGEGYDAYAPLHNAADLEGELLLVHGTGDDNVHFQNSVQMVQALQEAGKQFDFMLYPNKTHSIGGLNTQLHLWTMMTDWLTDHLPSRPVT